MIFKIIFFISCFSLETITVSEPIILLKNDYNTSPKTNYLVSINMPCIQFFVLFHDKETFQKYFFHFNNKNNNYLYLNLFYYDMINKDNLFKYIGIKKNTNFKFEKNKNFFISFNEQTLKFFITLTSSNEKNFYNFLIKNQFYSFKFILTFENIYLNIDFETIVFRIILPNLELKRVGKKIK